MRRDPRSALLDVAQQRFAVDGFAGTSVRDLAAAVGIKESSVYNHFASKQAVLDALLVPQRAVSVDAGGTASVLVAQEGGAFAQVVVTELGCTAGTCAVASEDGRLAEGMSVRVDG